MKTNYFRLGILVFFSLVLSLFASRSSAQPAIDRAAREIDRPIRKEVEKKMQEAPKKPPVVVEEKKRPAIKGPKFFIKEIRLDGTETFPPEDFRYIIEKYENKEVSFEELNILANEIEREYLRRGVIAACFVPPQDIKDGIVTLRVVEAKMGDIKIRQDSRLFDEDILTFYWRIKKGDTLRYDLMSESLQEMNKNPDRLVRATLQAGTAPGTTDVILDSETWFPIHVTGSFDREGPFTTGRERWGLGIKDNNFLFVDDTLMAGISFGRDFSSQYAYHSIPVTNCGTSIMYGYSDNKAYPKKEFTDLQVDSRSRTYSIFLYQDVFYKYEYVGNLSFGLDAKDKRLRNIAGTTTRDRLRILRWGANITHTFPGCVTYMNPEISQGINGLGAKRRSDLSSRGADNTFTKFELDLSHRRALPIADMQASWRANFQFASEKLMPQEEYSLGGINSVRGYPDGDFQADNAFQTNFELLVPPFFLPDDWTLPYDDRPLKDIITGVAFIDYGYGIRRGKNHDEKREANMASIGAGVRIRLYQQVLARLEWGFVIGDNPVTETADSRFHVSIDFEDQLHREFARLKRTLREDDAKNIAWKLLDDQMKDPASPIKKEMHRHLYLAMQADKAGDLKEAKKQYGWIVKSGNALYRQAHTYVKECFKQQDALKDLDKQAKRYYREKEFDKARDAWEKVIDGAAIKPLALEI